MSIAGRGVWNRARCCFGLSAAGLRADWERLRISVDLFRRAHLASLYFGLSARRRTHGPLRARVGP